MRIRTTSLSCIKWRGLKEMNYYSSQQNAQSKKAKRRQLWLYLTTALIVLCSLMMLLLDEKNKYRPDFLDNNFVAKFLNAFDITRFNVRFSTWLLFLTAISLIFVVVAGFAFARPIRRLLKRQNDRHFNLIYFIVVAVLAVAGFILAYVLGAFDNLDTSKEIFMNLLYTVLIFLAFVLIVPTLIILAFYVIKLVVFFIGRIVSKIAKSVIGDEEYRGLKEELAEGGGGNGSATIGGQANDNSKGRLLFPGLMEIDRKYEEYSYKNPKLPDDFNLEHLVLRLQAYLCKKKYYFPLPILRAFIAGLATSHFLILEGLSGTGKSTLPREFSDFVGSKVFYCPVQATWRDRTDIVGYYNDFSKDFKETEFLKRMYESSYAQERLNLMVLDEMNISRIEYYFADFLSVFEYPTYDWLINLMQLKGNEQIPNNLENGKVRIQTNTWFIGTANTDDSTFTITDKVYDRAIVIDFNERNAPFTTDYNSDPLDISVTQLQELFDEARANEALHLDDNDREKFLQICDFCVEAFEIRFGNRIMNQIENLVPVYVACGGTKEAALDLMFARKVLRKLEGKYDDYVKDGLNKLSLLIKRLYGEGAFIESEKTIANLMKKLI